MARARVFILTLVTIVGISFTHSSRAILIEKSLESLVENSEIAGAGKVTNIESLWEGQYIVSFVKISVQGELSINRAGYHKQTIRVKILGGEVGDLGMRVFTEPELSIDQDIFFFLQRSDSAEHYEFTFNRLGVLPIDKGRVATPTSEDTSVLELLNTIKNVMKMDEK